MILPSWLSGWFENRVATMTVPKIDRRQPDMQDFGIPPPLRRLQIDLLELEVAFGNSSVDMSYYLDLETGRVILVTSEARRIVESAPRPAPDEESDGLAPYPCTASGLSGWLLKAIEDAAQVDADAGGRYVAIPTEDSHAIYQDMQEFVGTVESEALRERLWAAVQDRGAVRLFRDILSRYPEERRRWFEYEQESTLQRILDWLATRGVEPSPGEVALANEDLNVE
jgi:hypothetical protein